MRTKKNILALCAASMFVFAFHGAEAATSLEASSQCYAKIQKVYDQPEILKKTGRLDNAIEVSRRAILEYLDELAAIYAVSEPDTAVLLADLSTIKNYCLTVEAMEQAKYGENFVDFELLNRQREILPLVGDIFAKQTARDMAEGEAKLSAADRELGRDFKRWEARDWQAMEDYLNHLEIEYLQRFGLSDQFYAPVVMRMFEKEIERARTVGKYADDHPYVLALQGKLLRYYGNLGYSDQAIKLGEKILPLTEKTFEHQNAKVLPIMKVLGDEYASVGRYKDSEAVTKRRLKYAEQAKNEGEGTLAAQNDLVRLYLKSGRYLEGYRLLNDLLDKAKGLDRENEVRNQIRLSSCISLDSQGLFEKANNLYRLIPDKTMDMTMDKLRVMSDMNRGKIFYGMALSSDLMLAMADNSLLGNSHHLTLADLCGLSEKYLDINNIDGAANIAAETLSKSVERYGKMHPVTLKARRVLADAYRRRGELSKAWELDRENYADSAKLFGKNSLEELAASDSLARDYAAAGEYDRAVKKYEDVVSRYRKHIGHTNAMPWQVMNRLAEACIEKGEYARAVETCETIIKSKPNFQARIVSDDMETLLLAAKAYRLSNESAKAVEYYDRALKGLETVRKYSYLTEEQLSHWFARIVPTYKEQALAYMAAGKSNEELASLIDLCKARNLVDRYSEYQALYHSGLDSEDIRQDSDLAALISLHDDAMDKARREQNDDLYLSLEISRLNAVFRRQHLKGVLEAKNADYKKARSINLADAARFKENLSAIPSDAYFVDYTILPDKGQSNKILITVADNRCVVKILSVEASSDFLRQCELYRQILSAADMKSFRQRYGYLHKLPDGTYKVEKVMGATGLMVKDDELRAAGRELGTAIGEVLLAPLSSYISSGGRDWIICPDGVLSNLPFETLRHQDKMLIETTDVSYTPSLSVLKLLRDREKGGREDLPEYELLAVGAVDYGRYDAGENSEERNFDNSRGKEPTSPLSKLIALKWSYLPGTNDELRNVSEMFAPASRKILRGAAATERNLKKMDEQGELKHYKYLLFATHGLYVPPYPELSSILLRPDDLPVGGRYENDGYITVGEWMGYNLDSELTYLSACESGLGGFRAGEGIVGIPYALCVAGNKNTVMSLWKVGDQSTAKFTSTFFAKLREGESARRALSETKREFMNDYRYEAPAIWSAFLLYGD